MMNWIAILCILHCALCIVGCSVPKLETPQCTEARDAVKRFYSFHFGNDMRASQENLTAREAFLTEGLVNELRIGEQEVDYFTKTDAYPKAFRVGTCAPATDGEATLQVLLFWRDDNEYRSEQREVHVEAVKTGDKWLINKVTN